MTRHGDLTRDVIATVRCVSGNNRMGCDPAADCSICDACHGRGIARLSPCWDIRILRMDSGMVPAMHIRSPTVLFWIAGAVLVLLVILLRQAGDHRTESLPAQAPADATMDGAR